MRPVPTVNLDAFMPLSTTATESSTTTEVNNGGEHAVTNGDSGETNGEHQFDLRRVNALTSCTQKSQMLELSMPTWQTTTTATIKATTTAVKT